MLFNLVLIVHFIAFLIFLAMLMKLHFTEEKVLNSYSVVIGLILLLTGVILVMLSYPNIHYNKIIPKSILFIIISICCGMYSGKPMPKKEYYLLLICAILASLIAVYNV